MQDRHIDEGSPGEQASKKRKGIRSTAELTKQVARLRGRAVELDQYADEMIAKDIESVRMDGATQFNRAVRHLERYLRQVSRWAGGS
ncbi:MAG: hypothetical protein HQ518_29310 [Rhodopirellula sp.]|nr:hypothetical protein [Rhodopirellula sp.]